MGERAAAWARCRWLRGRLAGQQPVAARLEQVWRSIGKRCGSYRLLAIIKGLVSYRLGNTPELQFAGQ